MAAALACDVASEAREAMSAAVRVLCARSASSASVVVACRCRLCSCALAAAVRHLDEGGADEVLTPDGARASAGGFGKGGAFGGACTTRLGIGLAYNIGLGAELEGLVGP